MDKIVCIGKNYTEHVKELGDTVSDQPIVFIKPPSVLRTVHSNGETLRLSIPPEPCVLHHECEIVLKLRKGGYLLSEKEANDAIDDVTVGLDMTLRDKQTELKRKGLPWTVSKVFLDSAVVGPWRKKADFPDFLNEPFSCSVDGKLRQQGMGKDMLFDPVACVVHTSRFFPLVSGDLIFTGSPAGVGAITAGQTATLQWGKILYSVTWKAYEK